MKTIEEKRWSAANREIVNRIKVLRHEGFPEDTIAFILNEEGVKPRQGRKWHENAVKDILRRR